MAHQWILSCAKYHIDNRSFARFHLVFKFALMTLCIRMTYLWHYHKKVCKKRNRLCVKQAILFITYNGNVTNYHQGTHTPTPDKSRPICLQNYLFKVASVLTDTSQSAHICSNLVWFDAHVLLCPNITWKLLTTSYLCCRKKIICS